METSQKLRSKRDRIKGLFKRTPNASQPATPDPSISATPPPKTEIYGDRERTIERYREATKLLQEAVKGHEKRETFDFPELRGEPEDFNDSQFKDKIDGVLKTRKDDVKDSGMWKKCEHAVQCAFTAFSPFAKNFLTIATQGAAVYPTHESN
jgi:hypothetical protein